MRSIPLDRIITSVPIDRTAQTVTSSGTHFEFKIDIHQVHSHAPLPTRDIPKSCLVNKEFINLTGFQTGRLKVIGLSESVKKAKTLWVVRCACGYYEHRTTKTLKSIHPDRAMCERCDRLEQRKNWNGDKR